MNLATTVGTVGTKRINYPNPDSQNFINLEQYLKLAKSVICRFSHRRISNEMLKSEDAISFVAENMIMGDWRYEQERGCSQDNYRIKCAIWAIRDYISRSKTRNNYRHISLDQKHAQQHYKSKCLIDMLVDEKQTNPLDNVIYKEHQTQLKQKVKQLLNNYGLSKCQKTCIKMRYLDEMRVQDIAKKLNVSRQAVQQNIKKGIDKLQQKVTNEF